MKFDFTEEQLLWVVGGLDLLTIKITQEHGSNINLNIPALGQELKALVAKPVPVPVPAKEETKPKK